jgi:hypothetical protein
MWLAWIASAPAQELRTVTVIERVYGEGKTPEQGHQEARQRARAKAAEVAGVHIASQLLGLQVESPTRRFQAYAELIRSSASGLIVDQQDSIWTEVAPGTTMPVYCVKLTATVAAQGKRNPGFTLDIKVNGQAEQAEEAPVATLRAGEELVLAITATQDCYLTVFNILPSDTVTVLAPNRYLREAAAQAMVPYQLPPESLRQQGFHLRAEPLPGQREHEEMLLVVATRTNIPFRETGVQTGQAALMAINRWLINIPPGQRTEASVLYRIVR